MRGLMQILRFASVLLIILACGCSSTSSNDPVTNTEAANSGLEIMRDMAEANSFEFMGYDSESDIGDEELGSPIELKTINTAALLQSENPGDSLIIDKNAYIFPVMVRGRLIGSIEVAENEETGDWEMVSTGGKSVIHEALEAIAANKFDQNECYILDMEEIELVFVGYKNGGRNVLIPLYSSSTCPLVVGEKYYFSDIAGLIKSEMAEEQELYSTMIPPEASEEEQTPLLDDMLGQMYGNGIVNGENGISSKTLDVDMYPQEQNQWCWAATGRMTMVYAGGDPSVITQCAEANSAFSQTSCCSNGSTSKCNQPYYPLYDDWGFAATEKYRAKGAYLSWDDFKLAIDEGKPVAFLWHWNSGGGHYQVATGYYEDASKSPATRMVYVNNPWPPNEGEQTSYTYASFIGGPLYNHLQTCYFYDIKLKD
jgi:hypothetical protein